MKTALNPPCFKTKQAGTSGWTTLLLLSLLAGLAYLAVKITPAYFEQKKVRFALHSVVALDEAGSFSRSQLEQSLLNRLQIDDIDSVKRRHIFVSKDGGQWQMRVAYERQVPITASIDVLLKYDETVAVPR